MATAERPMLRQIPIGPGAGGMATASAVVSDIGDIARGVRAIADRSQPVERGDAKRSGEVAVGAAAGGPFHQIAPEEGSHIAGD